jgi:hypothetical protein
MEQNQTIKPLMGLWQVPLPPPYIFPQSQPTNFIDDRDTITENINIGSGNQNVNIGNPSPVSVTDVATPTYTALPTDYMLCVLTNGPVTITLPTGILGTVYIVKDCFGEANINPITIQGTGGQLVDGSTGTINSPFGAVQLIFNGTDWSIV